MCKTGWISIPASSVPAGTWTIETPGPPCGTGPPHRRQNAQTPHCFDEKLCPRRATLRVKHQLGIGVRQPKTRRRGGAPDKFVTQSISVEHERLPEVAHGEADAINLSD